MQGQEREATATGDNRRHTETRIERGWAEFVIIRTSEDGRVICALGRRFRVNA